MKGLEIIEVIALRTQLNFVSNINQIKNLYNFLGVSAHFVPPSLEQKINNSKKGTVVERTVIKRLKEHFNPHITDLENYLSINLKIWK